MNRFTILLLLLAFASCEKEPLECEGREYRWPGAYQATPFDGSTTDKNGYTWNIVIIDMKIICANDPLSICDKGLGHINTPKTYWIIPEHDGMPRDTFTWDERYGWFCN
jgi:hypothetical protein